ncbi:class I SAM-dependent methyltransferase [Enterococcus sp. HY326]|uniref:class I SAM-dependent methyltransferase n=1 Tax=Enterococcus sp. HY326 TaxID=2971265 RepID=UPI00223FFA11|nr:class I SAM-dependent methyltransferase [Enterococcus sp. HY326]
MTVTYDLLLHYLNRQAKGNSERIITELDIKNRQTIVDIGAGGGHFSYQFAKVNLGNEVVAIDVDQRHLDFIERQSVKQNLKNIRTLLVNTEDNSLPLGDNSVDLFFMRNMFHDLTTPQQYFANLKRKLNDSGRIAIVEFLPNLKYVEGRTGHCTEERTIQEIMTSAGYSLKASSVALKPKESFTIYGV